MVSFFAEQAGVTTEECAKYQQANIPCSQFDKCPPIAKVISTRQIFNAKEADIQREILLNGPVMTDWAPPATSDTYLSGILAQTDV